MSCWFRVRCLDHKESPSFPFFRVLPWARHDPGGICHPCVMDEATRAQRDPVTCLGSHRSKRRNEITGLGLPCRIAEMRSIPQAFLKLSGCLSFGFSCSVEGARGGGACFLRASGYSAGESSLRGLPTSVRSCRPEAHPAQRPPCCPLVPEGHAGFSW